MGLLTARNSIQGEVLVLLGVKALFIKGIQGGDLEVSLQVWIRMMENTMRKGSNSLSSFKRSLRISLTLTQSVITMVFNSELGIFPIRSHGSSWGKILASLEEWNAVMFQLVIQGITRGLGLLSMNMRRMRLWHSSRWISRVILGEGLSWGMMLSRDDYFSWCFFLTFGLF